MAEAYYYSEFLLREIARRLKTDLKIVQGMYYEEIKDALLKDRFNIKTVKERISNSWMLSYDGIFFDLSDKYKKIVKSNILDIHYKNNLIIKGQVACPGKAVGKVKIINSVKDMEKMKKGDILVSYMTSPSIVSAMRKASAIITDIGGMTCHAAVISRELKIPCIVGTKSATSSLSDGVEVEVDAANGIAKILKNKK